jgi:lysophospholipase L1-like esterase
MESKFRFKSGVNLVDSEKASHGQLAILAPYGGNVFSEIVKCEDGTVTFTLTKEMIDQLKEVGLYSFQIRLFDYYRESRVSIPPVEFGIEVREPVASEDHDNTVNEAIVGYSIAKVVDGLNEDVPDTFDDNGQYNKTEWKTGDRISQGKLNKIEDALDTINQNEKTDVAALDKRVTNNFNVLNSTKADLSYVDTRVGALAAGGPKGVYTSLSALQTAFPKGNSNIYITSNNGNWNYWNGSAWVSGGIYQSTGLENNSVLPVHLNGGIERFNLYNRSMLQVGYINMGNTAIVPDEPHRYAKIPVEPNRYYVLGRNLSGVDFMFGTSDCFVFLDSNDQRCGQGPLSNFTVKVDAKGRYYAIIYTPSDASYICVNVKVNAFDVSNDENGILIAESENNTSVNFDLDEACGIYKIFDTPIADREVRSSFYSLKKSIITEQLYESQNNITILTDMLYNHVGKLETAKDWKAGNITVKPNTQYSIYFESQIYATARGVICFLDISETILSNLDWGTATIKTIEGGSNYVTFTTPAKCEYIGVTLASGQSANYSYDDTNSFLLIEGDVITKEGMTPMVNSIDGYKVFSPKDLQKHRSYLNIPTITTLETNMFTREETIINKGALYGHTGEFEHYQGWYSADIPVEGGKTYYFYSPAKTYTPSSRGVICRLNKDRGIIGPISGQNTNLYELDNGVTWQVIETTEDTCYIGITLKGPNSVYNDLIGGVFTDIKPREGFYGKSVTHINGMPIMTNNVLPLQGKKWVVVGDSLTESNIRATKNYHNYVAEDTGVTVVNMGVSGSGYKRREEDNNAFYQRILNVPTDTDIITFFGSGNDLSLTLGTPNDTGTDTICGCMHQTFKNLFEIIPGAKVGVVLPCPWGSYPPSDTTNKMALYCEALKEIAGYYSIPVLDLYHGSNLRPWDTTFRDLYYKRDDGGSVHPDEDGHKILANKFKMFIQSL